MKLVLLFAVLTLANALPTVEDNEGSNWRANVEDEVRRAYAEYMVNPSFKTRVFDVKFSWNNCGDASKDPVLIKSCSMSPDPILIPGNVTVSGDGLIKHTIERPTSLALVIKRKMFGVYIEIPCVDNLGSCTYNDPCSFLKNVTCPPEVVKMGWNCSCPLPANEIIVTNKVVAIPDLPLPSFVENSGLQVQATLMNGEERVFCYQIQFSMRKK